VTVFDEDGNLREQDHSGTAPWTFDVFISDIKDLFSRCFSMDFLEGRILTNILLAVIAVCAVAITMKVYDSVEVDGSVSAYVDFPYSQNVTVENWPYNLR